MTEVYSILNQASPGADSGFVIGVSAFWGAIFFILLFSLIKKLTTQGLTLRKIAWNIIAMVFILGSSFLFAVGVWSDEQLYNECMDAWESGSYSVEVGEPGSLSFYPSEDEDGNVVYEVSFWVNGKYFDSYYAYGEGHFSRKDLKLIENGEIFEVKYIVDDANDNIMLSMSVGEKSD